MSDQNNPYGWKHNATNQKLDSEDINALIMMDDDIDGYHSYPGYTLLKETNRYNYEYPHIPVVEALEETDGYRNLLTRLFVPNEYTLHYLDTSNGFVGTQKYTYGTRTELVKPTRPGYEFDGWTILQKIGEDEDGKALYDEDNAQRVGVDFAFYSSTDPAENEKYAFPVDENGYGDIYLRAEWKAKSFNITYVWSWDDADLNAALAELNQDVFTDEKLTKFTFDEQNDKGERVKAIPAPIREGYEINGWWVRHDEDGDGVFEWLLQDEDKDGVWEKVKLGFDENLGHTLVLSTYAYHFDIELVADWIPETYDIELDCGEGGSLENDPNLSVTFDSKLTISAGKITLPTKLGHDFLGFFSAPEGGVQYIDAEGKAVDRLWAIDDGVYNNKNGTVKLYAQWEPSRYDVSFEIKDADGNLVEGVEIVVTPEGGTDVTLANGETVRDLIYGTTFDLSIKVPTNSKVVAWYNGEENCEITHANPFVVTRVLVGAWEGGAGSTVDMTLTAKVLPEQPLDLTEAANVNYYTEKLTGLLTGDYKVLIYERVDGDLRHLGTDFFTVSSSEAQIKNEWFGKTVQIVYCGDGVTRADSDPCTIDLATRPTAPTDNSENPKREIEYIQPGAYEIKISMMPDYVGKYEFAILENGEREDALLWQDDPVFTKDANGVKSGTHYTVYIRCKATDNAPHGEEFKHEYRTSSVEYIRDMTNLLEDLREGKGPLANAEIDAAIAELERLEQLLKDDPTTSATFYEKVEALMASITAKLELATEKDDRLADLKDTYETCLDCGIYTDERRAELDQIYNDAVAAITAAPTKDSVNVLYTDAVNALEDVELNALRVNDSNGDLLLESEKGLAQGTELRLTAQPDFDALRRAISKAIRTSGKVAVGDFSTPEKAEALLRQLDIVAYYKLELVNGTLKNGDFLTITLQLPKELQGKSGLHVAYYNPDTGVVELLETTVSKDGKSITFRASEVRDFVIFADPTVPMLGVIGVLGGILLCQMIALALILVSRSKSKKNTAHACVAFPAALLTVYFTPVGGEIIALVLGAAVIVMQIVLMVLLLKSDIVYAPKKRDALEGLPTEAEENEQMYADETAENAETAADGTAVDGEDAYLAFTYGAMAENAEDAEADPFAMYDGDDAEDFIEPAAATRYSLSDEEFAAYDDAQAEDAAEDAEDFAEESYAEESTDGIDAVFGLNEEAELSDSEEGATEWYGEEETSEESYEETYGEVPEEEEAFDAAVYADDAEETYEEDMEADAYVDASEQMELADETDSTEGADFALDDADAVAEEEYFFETPEEPATEDETDSMYRYDE
ncbi:MAG: InlB B-repeat-containing protein [Clostridia bacterium]|nr:InlB B-repeat-containing protein [Clostridia bacterium]